MPEARAHAEKKPHQVKFWESNALLAAAKGGHGAMAIWMFTDIFNGFYMQSNQEVMDQLASHGDLEAVRRLVAEGWQPPRLDFAADGGNIALVQWLLDQHKDLGKQWALKNAAAKGHLAIVKLLVNEGIVYLDDQAFCDAAANGHLAVVQTLKENNLGWNMAYKAIDLAASHGHLEIVQYLHGVCSGSCTHRTMRAAAGSGHLHVVQWLHTQFADDPNVDLYEAGTKQQFNTTVMDVSAVNGHLHVIKYLHEVALAMETVTATVVNQLDQLSGGMILEKTIPTCTPAAIQFAAAGGHLEVLRWLYANYWTEPSVDVMDVAAASGNLMMIKWLHENTTAKFSSAAMDGAAREGHLAIVKWLHENRSEGCTVKAMDDAAAMGHLHVLQWLNEHRSESCSAKALEGAASEGHFDVALFLASKYPELGGVIEHDFIENRYISSWLEEEYPQHD
ncbi:unnamed protein product [Phytophthora fragariaefolia]|uniref:Unnamed protein product n=1 Tax=Phytophthora fragariaefolia TaxID=1490495 RepID=A0A9W6XJF2_9STRA|nr:unnamed protein product [Phytophthora fragariaefolia]